MSKLNRLFAIVGLFALMCVSALAQSTVTGAIGGSVTDPQKAVVPGATVKAINTGTNQESNVTTDSEGRYRISNLDPGTYSVTFSASGFGELKVERAIVEVGQITNVDAALSIGEAQGASVDITAEAPIINTESKDFATNINQISISELPINGRRWSNFAVLTPGTTPDGNFGLISFRGISGLLNNSTVDGGDNNQAFFSEERGRTRVGYSTSQSAIREFQVNTSNYSAEYGRAAGGAVNAVTKSGTNEFHGDLFYYQRNNKWGARNPLAFRSALVNGVSTRIPIKPEDVRHQFGGTIGGPIVKDRLFFFFSYDEQQRNFPGLSIFDSPGYLNSVSRTALTGRGLTNAQIDSALGFLNSLTGEVERTGDQRIFFPKLDWRINNSNTFTASYNRLRWESPAGIQTQATNARGRASFGDDLVEIDTVNLRLNSTISPNLLNEFRAQYSRDNEFQLSQPPLSGEPTTGINGSSPSVFLTSGLEFGKPTFLERVAFPDEKKLQFANTMTLAAGSHSFKFGGDVYRTRDLLDNLRNESGAYNYNGAITPAGTSNSLNDFIIDYTNWRTPFTSAVQCFSSSRPAGRCYSGNYLQGFGPTRSEVKTTDIAFFLQDDWRISPRLTLNLGLRWEYERLPEAVNPNPSTITVPNTSYTLNQATSNLPDDKNNFGPRVGFAYDITGDGKTSVRAGYGIYFGRIINSTISNALVNTGAAGGQFQFILTPTITRGTPPATITNPCTPVFPAVWTFQTLTACLSAAGISQGAGAIQFFSPKFAAPEIHQGDLIIERQIAQNTVVSASFLFSEGRKLPTFIDRNLSVPTSTITYQITGGPFGGQAFTTPLFTGSRPASAFAQLTEISSSVKSGYQALVLQANRRFTKGLQFQSSYTLSEARDTNQASVTFTANNSPFNVFDLSSERAASSFDVRHKFVASAVYSPDAKFENKLTDVVLSDWTIAPIYVHYSGRPITGLTSGNVPGGGIAGGINGSGGANRLPLAPRNGFREPSLWNVDLRLSRRFSFTESVKLEFLAEAFNLFNRTQGTSFNTTFYSIGGTATAPTLTYSPTFQSITEASGTLYRERQLQLALRLQF